MRSQVSGPHPWLVSLERPGLDRRSVGGKGVSLSRLIAIGAPVPKACALTVAAWEIVSASLDLPAIADGIGVEGCRRIRERITSAPLPVAVTDAIDDAYRAMEAYLGPGLSLAVRSSAVAEDAGETSFAGLHDTILDVRSPDALEAAVRQCWASLWSDRAIAYRRDQGIDGHDSGIAIVIQQLVVSDVSFVAFTTDPVTGRDDRLVICATWGLGEAVVSGLVHPDHVVLGADNAVIEYTVGVKQRMIIPASDSGEGTREVAVPRSMQAMPALTSAQAAEIGRMSRALALSLGYEADIEGGIAGDAIHLFQARPITTLESVQFQPSTPNNGTNEDARRLIVDALTVPPV